MLVVNIGTAQNLFEALKSSLSKNGLDFSKAISFTSMKGARSGVQIKNEHPALSDVGCVCHLADLTINAGIKTLPIDINQLLSMFSTSFITVVSKPKSLLTYGALFLPQSPT